VYFLFDAGAEWRESVPKPSYYAHQIIDDDHFLNPKVFLAKIEEALKRLPRG
jgi:hypothetical protein